MANIILFNKPFNVLSQFTDNDGRPTLADYITAPGYRVAGRLDRNGVDVEEHEGRGEARDQHREEASRLGAWKQQTNA